MNNTTITPGNIDTALDVVVAEDMVKSIHSARQYMTALREHKLGNHSSKTVDEALLAVIRYMETQIEGEWA